MPDNGNGGEAIRGADRAGEPAEEELGEALRTGSGARARAGGLALLAFLVAGAAVAYYHFSDTGGSAYAARLDAELLGQAELTLAAGGEGGRLAIVPSWPLGLYATLRRDMALYATAAALAAMLWAWSARARARRDLFLLNEKMRKETAELRRRLEKLEK